MERTRIVIAAGGTAGHVVPALAIADALRGNGVDVVFIGGDRAERDLVPAAGYELRRVGVEGLDRRNPLRAAHALGRAARATGSARRLLRELAADAVLGGGGYVAGPVCLAARTLGIPIVLTEADSHLGLTNRLLAPIARRVCLAFPIDGRRPPRYRVTGRPLPAPHADRDAARARLGIAADEPCLLVFGGSLGARSINEAALEAFAAAELRVIHVAGRRDFQTLRERPRHDRYDLREYMSIDEFSAALAASDLVVARAGGSVLEIAAHGLPAILVPYPHASADHQAANARWLERGGAALVIPDAELTAARLSREVAELLAHPGRRAAMGHAARALAPDDAADVVAAELLSAARG